MQQVRETKWYNQLPISYKAEGIIVGKDSIEADDRIVKKMLKQGTDPNQAKIYISNNRHNQVTALYYLLKIKVERDPTFLQD